MCEAGRQSAEPGSLSEALEAPNLVSSSRREQSGAEPPRRGDGHLLGRPRKVLARPSAGVLAARQPQGLLRGIPGSMHGHRWKGPLEAVLGTCKKAFPRICFGAAL